MLTGHKKSSAADTDGVGRGGYPAPTPLAICSPKNGKGLLDRASHGPWGHWQAAVAWWGFWCVTGLGRLGGEARFELVFRFFLQKIPFFATNKQMFADFRYCQIHTLCMYTVRNYVHTLSQIHIAGHRKIKI